MKRKKEFEDILLKTIHLRAAQMALDTINKVDKNTFAIRFGIAMLLSTIAASFLVWWAFIPAIIIYIVSIYVNKVRSVKQLIPVIVLNMVITSISGLEEEIKEVQEDLDTKKHNGIYNENEISQIEEHIVLMKESIDILNNHKSELIFDGYEQII